MADRGRPGELSEDVLGEIRRAAFELRRTDAQEAVRVLRRAAAQGGEAEVLARGALGEIYLEEFGDLDGAEHEFRAVLAAAPGLPAAEWGLARTLREAGNVAQAEQALHRAVAGMARDLAGLREARTRGEPLPPGAEELVLTLLEVAVELAEVRAGAGTNGVRRTQGAVSGVLDEAVLSWAWEERLLDAAAGDEDPDGESPDQTDETDAELAPDLAAEDWLRFHTLWARLRTLEGGPAAAARTLAEAEALGQLRPRDAARLQSHALEEAGDVPGAAAQALRGLDADAEASRAWEPDEVLRTAALLDAAGHPAGSREILQRALGRSGLEPAVQDDAHRRYREALESLEESPVNGAGLVRLGRKAPPSA